MENIENLVIDLCNKDASYAYKCLKRLENESEVSNSVYSHFDTFVQMLDSPNSYIRTRGIILISANAKWDVDYKIDEIIDQYLMHIIDDKPVTARQCIQCLPGIAKYKPELVDCICTALRNASPNIYADSMQALVCKDISAALEQITCYTEKAGALPL